MTIQLAYQRVLAALFTVYDTREAANIANMVIEHVTGQPKIERITYRDIPVSEAQQAELERVTAALQAYQPVQYVLGEAWFMDMKLTINEQVLIPRPETEELADWIIKDCRHQPRQDVSIIDIGTGSGCLPIALKKYLPAAAVSALEVSEQALQVAKLNSVQQNVLVDFLLVDFLNEMQWKQLGRYDIIVSNPPYIKQSEAQDMSENVLAYEPHLALFVPDEDTLLFYRYLARFASQHLADHGHVYVEINEALGQQVVALFQSAGFSNVVLRKDMQGKDRMVRAGK